MRNPGHLSLFSAPVHSDRVGSRKRTLVLVLGLVALSGALTFRSGGGLPSEYREAVHKSWQTITERRDDPLAEEIGPPISLRVAAVEPALQFEWSDAAVPAPAGVETKRFLRIEWTVEEGLISRAVSAELEIRDGGQIQQFSIELPRLRHGSRVHFPRSGDIQLEMRIMPEQGNAEVAIARFVSAQAPPELNEERQERETVLEEFQAELRSRRSLEDRREDDDTSQVNRSPPVVRPEPLASALGASEVPEVPDPAGTEAPNVVLMQKGPAVLRTSSAGAAEE